jgi:hypothetical protein
MLIFAGAGVLLCFSAELVRLHLQSSWNTVLNVNLLGLLKVFWKMGATVSEEWIMTLVKRIFAWILC